MKKSLLFICSLLLGVSFVTTELGQTEKVTTVSAEENTEYILSSKSVDFSKIPDNQNFGVNDMDVWNRLPPMEFEVSLGEPDLVSRYFYVGNTVFDHTILSFLPREDATEYYIRSTLPSEQEIAKIELKETWMLFDETIVNLESFGLYVYSDDEMLNEIDHIDGNLEELFWWDNSDLSFTPTNGKTWPKNSYFKIVFNITSCDVSNIFGAIICIGCFNFYVEKTAEIQEDVVYEHILGAIEGSENWSSQANDYFLTSDQVFSNGAAQGTFKLTSVLKGTNGGLISGNSSLLYFTLTEKNYRIKECGFTFCKNVRYDGTPIYYSLLHYYDSANETYDSTTDVLEYQTNFAHYVKNVSNVKFVEYNISPGYEIQTFYYVLEKNEVVYEGYDEFLSSNSIQVSIGLNYTMDKEGNYKSFSNLRLFFRYEFDYSLFNQSMLEEAGIYFTLGEEITEIKEGPSKIVNDSLKKEFIVALNAPSNKEELQAMFNTSFSVAPYVKLQGQYFFKAGRVLSFKNIILMYTTFTDYMEYWEILNEFLNYFELSL